MSTAAVPQDKATLVKMLNQACELEHALACQYLYAGFTMKQPGDPGKVAQAIVRMADEPEPLPLELSKRASELSAAVAESGVPVTPS